MKVARTVLSGGKAGDNLKGLPIAIKGENCFKGRQGSTAYPEEYSHKPNGGFCVQGIGALQQVSAKQSRP